MNLKFYIYNKFAQSKPELVDSAYLFVLQGINQLFPLIVLPYLMKCLGAYGYGMVGYALAVVQYVDLIVTFGFNLSATKLIAQVRSGQRQYSMLFWNVLTAKLCLFIISCLFLCLCLNCIPELRAYKWSVYATLPMALGSMFTYIWLFQGLGLIRIFSIMNTCSKLCLLPLIFIFVKTKEDYLAAAFLQAIVFVATAIVSNIYLFKKKLICWERPTRRGVFMVMKDSLPLFLSSASTSIYTQLFIVILGFYCTTEMIGSYTSAERIMRAVVFILYVPISQSFFPKISNQVKESIVLARKSFDNAKLLVAFLMFSVSIFLFLGAPYISQWLGKSYENFEVLLKIMTLAPIAIGLGAVYGQLGLIAMGNSRDRSHFRNVYFISALVSVVSVFLLVPFLKEIGAACSLVFSEWLVCILMIYYNKKK